MEKQQKTCIIIGGGIAGPTLALALNRANVSCSIYELRDTPSTIGGAINLTPIGIRLIKDLGVDVKGPDVDSLEIFSLHSKRKIGDLPFSQKIDTSLRVIRNDLQKALLDACEDAKIPVNYGSKLTSIEEDEETGLVTATFANGKTAKAYMLIGTDGVHSAVRTQYVEPSRQATYAGASTAYSFIKTSNVKNPIHFESAAMNLGMHGSIMAAYIHEDKSEVYLGTIMPTPEQNGKDGWRTRGADNEATAREIERRFGDSVHACIPEMTRKMEETYFHPVHIVGTGGRWNRGNVAIIGDAAHAMPPQGESTGLCIEDAILMARCIGELPDSTPSEAFQVYDRVRRPRIDAAHRMANIRWATSRDKSWYVMRFIEWFAWIFLWFMQDSYRKEFAYDVRKEPLIITEA